MHHWKSDTAYPWKYSTNAHVCKGPAPCIKQLDPYDFPQQAQQTGRLPVISTAKILKQLRWSYAWKRQGSGISFWQTVYRASLFSRVCNIQRVRHDVVSHIEVARLWRQRTDRSRLPTSRVCIRETRAVCTSSWRCRQSECSWRSSTSTSKEFVQGALAIGPMYSASCCYVVRIHVHTPVLEFSHKINARC